MESLVNERFLEMLGANYVEALQIIKRKNADYSSRERPFLNFERSAELGGVSVERSILVRLGDKLSRIENLLDKPPSVTDEKLRDTIIDGINYLNILLVYMEWEPRDEPSPPSDDMTPEAARNWFSRLFPSKGEKSE